MGIPDSTLRIIRKLHSKGTDIWTNKFSVWLRLDYSDADAKQIVSMQEQAPLGLKVSVDHGMQLLDANNKIKLLIVYH
jgi:hypothetical protein